MHRNEIRETKIDTIFAYMKRSSLYTGLLEELKTNITEEEFNVFFGLIKLFPDEKIDCPGVLYQVLSTLYETRRLLSEESDTLSGIWASGEDFERLEKCKDNITKILELKVKEYESIDNWE